MKDCSFYEGDFLEDEITGEGILKYVLLLLF